MRELLGKIGQFCENHVEKLVLAVVGIFCAWLFFTWVIFSPYVVTVGNREFSPGQIDRYVQEQAKELEGLLAQIDDEEEAADPGYVSIMEGPIDPCSPVVADVFVARPKPESFASMFESPLAYLAPADGTALAGDRVKDRPKYFLPPIGDVADVAVNYIRAAAYIPLTPIDPQNRYDNAEVEPNDIDLVTVEAKFDVENLYRQFRAYFAGTEVEKQQWRDPCLAEPVFAAVQLQRQTLLNNGLWSDWEDVPRSRIEANRDLLSIVENVEDLPTGGLGVRLMRYDNPMIAMELLQPSAYQIASADEDWFPPSFYDKFKSLQRKVEAEEKRKEREERMQERDRDTNARGGRTGGRMTSRTRTGGAAGGRRRSGGAGGGLYGGTGGGRTRGGRSRDRTGAGMPGAGGRRGATDDMTMGGAYGPGMMGDASRMGPSTDEVYIEFAENSLTYATDMTKLEEPLLIWRFDDTAEPGQSYRYRLRVGVFNPVAGMDKVAQEDADREDQVILWSEFSDVTEPVKIPNRLYFFAKNVQEQTKTATVGVARYALGQWRTEDFKVKPGEVIGQKVEPRDEEDERLSRRQRRDRMANMPGREMNMMNPGGPGMMNRPMGLGVDSTALTGGKEDEAPRPDIIDFRTHAVLIDLVQVNDLGPELAPRAYYDMLYSHDGIAIEHMPAKSALWPSELRAIHQQIIADEREEQDPFRAFGEGGLRNRRGGGMRGMDGGMNPYGMGMNPY